MSSRPFRPAKLAHHPGWFSAWVLPMGLAVVLTVPIAALSAPAAPKTPAKAPAKTAAAAPAKPVAPKTPAPVAETPAAPAAETPGAPTAGPAGSAPAGAAPTTQELVKSLIGSAVENPGPEYKEVGDAITRFKNRDFEGALALLKVAKQKHPELAPAQVMMAQMFFAANQVPTGANALEQAVVSDPADPEAYLILSDLAFRAGRFAEAWLLVEKADALTTAFKGNPRRKLDFQKRVAAEFAAVAERREQWDVARKYLETWVKLDPTSAAALHRLGIVLFQMKDVTKAYQQLQAAAKLDKTIPQPEVILGQLYEQAGDHTNAVTWMAKAIKQSPNDLQTRLAVARWDLDTNQLTDAQTQAAAALKIDPKSLEARFMRALVARLLKDYPTAETYLQSALVESPGNPMVTNQLALVLVEQSEEAKKSRALEYAEMNARQYSKSPDIAATLGWVYYKLGRKSEADTALRAAATGGALSADTAYYLARLDVDSGRSDEAKQLLQAAVASKQLFAYRAEAQALLAKLTSAAGTTEPKKPAEPKTKATAP